MTKHRARHRRALTRTRPSNRAHAAELVAHQVRAALAARHPRELRTLQVGTEPKQSGQGQAIRDRLRAAGNSIGRTDLRAVGPHRRGSLIDLGNA